MAFYFGADIALIAVFHVLFGVTWVSIHILAELILIPDIRKGEKLADLGILRHMPKISMVGAIAALATLGTGLLYLFAKFGTDFGVLLSHAEPRTIVIALVLVLAALTISFGLLRPKALALGKRAKELKPMDPLPEDFKRHAGLVVKLLRAQGAMVFATLILMVLATQGGI